MKNITESFIVLVSVEKLKSLGFTNPDISGLVQAYSKRSEVVKPSLSYTATKTPFDSFRNYFGSFLDNLEESEVEEVILGEIRYIDHINDLIDSNGEDFGLKEAFHYAMPLSLFTALCFEEVDLNKFKPFPVTINFHFVRT